MGWNLSRKLKTLHKMRDVKKAIKKIEIDNLDEVLEALTGAEAESISGLLDAVAALLPGLSSGLEDTAKESALELLDEAYKTAREYIESL